MYPHNIQMITRPPLGLLAVILVVLAASCVAQPSTQPVAEGTYTHMVVGNCGGHTFITSISDCAAAAVALGLDDIVPEPTTPNSYAQPYGCYYKWANTPGTKLWFNPDGTRSSSDTVRTSICHESKHPFLEVSSWKGLQAMTLHPSKLHIPNIVRAADSGARWLAAA